MTAMTPDKVEAALGVLNQATCLSSTSVREALSVLTEELAESRRDAARYRWLRDHRDEDGFVDPDFHVAVDSPKFRNKWALVGCELDTAIDAAMKDTDHDR